MFEWRYVIEVYAVSWILAGGYAIYLVTRDRGHRRVTMSPPTPDDRPSRALTPR
jgi:hypothetical protein